MPNLFNHNLIKTQVQNHHIESFEEKLKVIQGWKKSIQMNKGVNEKALQSAFLQGIFGRSLGYITFGDGDEWNLSIEVSTEVDATTPDGILGYYTADESITQAVIELKSPRHSLDKKQSRAGKDYGTPVDQAFSYASKYDRCSWVIVSNMNEIRLYKVGRSQEYYESFFIDDLVNIEEFKKFHLLLCKDNLIRRDGESPTYTLSEKTKERIQDISVSFYNLYKNIRIQLFEELKTSNPDYDNALLVEKAQKFLDRIIFICFCEDLGLLPNDLLHHAIQRGKDSFSDSEFVIWQEIRGVFRAIDAGSDKHNIPAYNGGLFAFDELLDNLSIKNDFFDAIYQISAYDFGTDLDVNILGHIFEQSIADIEELKAEVQSEDYDPQKSRRKKDGIYYTPSYITKYIVDNSLGKYLEDIRKDLGEGDLPDLDEAATAQVEGRYMKKLRQFYQNYEERLKQVKVLDPACGSGAFLNQAFDFLLEEYRWIHNKLSELGEGQISIFDSDAYQRSVLQNNLYGVDLNEESVEITKLSLWLKTADSRNALPYLDDNIKCGNSLIDDPEIAGDKAFNWQEEFANIMDNGGFDVIIGNPPYVQIELIPSKEKEYFQTKYSYFYKRGDLFSLFIEVATTLSTEDGYVSFIIPSIFLNNLSYKPLRKMLIDNNYLSLICYTGNKVFSGVNVDTVILVIKLNKSYQMVLVNATDFNMQITQKVSADYFVPYNYNISIDSNEENNISNKVFAEQNSMLGDSMTIFQGIVTGNNEAYIFDDEELAYKSGIEKQLLRTVCFGKDIGKWKIKNDRRRIIYITPETNINEFPGTKNWLLQYKDQLEKRRECKNGKIPWYSLQWPRDKDKLDSIPKIAIQSTRNERLRTRIVATIDEIKAYGTQGLNFIVMNNENSLSPYYVLAVLNSKLTNYLFSTKLKNLAIKADYLKQYRIPNASLDSQNLLANKSILMTSLNNKHAQFKDCSLPALVSKYASKNPRPIEQIAGKVFFNKIYVGKLNKLNNIEAAINDSMLTFYLPQPKKKIELFKIEIKDRFQRQYLKLYLENLTEEHLAEINQYSGNILDKVLQINIPDYDKPEVVRKVVNEWNQLQNEIKELESKIEATDKEIDQMVYELYGLTEDEIKIVEKETQ